jgi:hypothetical protein
MLQVLFLVFHITALLSAFLLARRSLRLGRGDRRGAFRLAVFVFSTELFGWLFGGRHTVMSLGVSMPHEIINCAWTALVLWMIYLGFEPHMRRLWPERIISWNRLLTGRFSDPLVGRDILIGCLLGLGEVLARFAGNLTIGLGGEGPGNAIRLSTLQGFQGLLRQFTADLSNAIASSMVFMIILLVMRILLRRQGLAVGFLWALGTVWVTFLDHGPHPGLRLAFVGLAIGFEVLAWAHFGLLAGATCYLTLNLCHYPLTLDPSAWYSGSTLFVVLVIVSLSLYGFASTVAGQPWFARSGVLDN